MDGTLTALQAVSRWWFAPAAASRIAWVRFFVYLLVIYDIFALTQGVIGNARLPAEMYQPVMAARKLHLATPTGALAESLRWVLVAACLVAMSSRLPRISGAVVAVAFTWWQLVNMSYGKVDHDHFALLVAVWVLPTAGRARFRDDTPSDKATWALRCIQVAAISTYSLAAWAKIRESGWGWASGATFYWALERRGTPLGRWLMDHPDLLRFGQWVVFVGELLSPVILLLRRWWLFFAIAFWLGFHLFTYLAIEIHFLPTVVCLTAFVPWEVVRRRTAELGRRIRRASDTAAPTSDSPVAAPAKQA